MHPILRKYSRTWINNTQTLKRTNELYKYEYADIDHDQANGHGAVLVQVLKLLPELLHYQKFERSIFLQYRTKIAPASAPPTWAKCATLSEAWFWKAK